MNRNIWGVEDFEEITIRHSKFAAIRFAHEAAPALDPLRQVLAGPFVNGIKAAREQIVARTDDDRETSCASGASRRPRRRRSSPPCWRRKAAHRESIFDFVQGITAVARVKTAPGRPARAGGRAAKLLAAA